MGVCWASLVGPGRILGTFYSGTIIGPSPVFETSLSIYLKLCAFELIEANHNLKLIDNVTNLFRIQWYQNAFCSRQQRN